MKETVITWTFANWVTVFLMAALGSMFIGIAIKLFTRAKAKAREND